MELLLHVSSAFTPPQLLLVWGKISRDEAKENFSFQSELSPLKIQTSHSLHPFSHLLSTACLHQCLVHPDYCYFLFFFFSQTGLDSLSLNHTRLFFLHVLVGKWCGNLTHPAASEQASRIGCHCHWYLTVSGKYYGNTREKVNT